MTRYCVGSSPVVSMSKATMPCAAGAAVFVSMLCVLSLMNVSSPCEIVDSLRLLEPQCARPEVILHFQGSSHLDG